MGRIKQVANKSKQPPPADKQTSEKPKKRVFSSNTLQMRDIRKQQRSTALLIKKKPFFRRARVVINKFNNGGAFNWTNNAQMTLIEAAQQFLIKRFEHAQKMPRNRKQVILKGQDMQLVRDIRERPIDNNIDLVLDTVVKIV